MSEDGYTNFTPRANQVLALARKEADRFNHGYVGTEHLLLGLIKLGQGVAVNVLRRMGLDPDSVREEVRKHVHEGQGDKVVDNRPYSPRAKKVLTLAGKEAKSLKHTYVGTEHILLGLLREGDGLAAKVLRTLDIDIEHTREEILQELDPNAQSSDDLGNTDVEEKFGEKKGEGRTPALRTFGRDLTDIAKKGEMDPVIGRKEEIERITQILCRRTKNNPVLLGEAGVGKTAIVEGLAQEIARGNVPEILRDKRIITLDLALMVAGTKYRGQFEVRIKAVMEEIRRSKNIILFIDELHTIVGAGSAEGTMDASNIIKPALSRGELQCVGATTMDEYRKYIEKDAALERRFQPVNVEAPSIEDAVEILKGVKIKYEEHHNITLTDAALEASVKLSDRYITGRYLPDKAIDLMDEAGACARIKSMTRPPDVKELEGEIDQIKFEKEKAIKNQDFEHAASMRDKEKQAKEKLETVLTAWKLSSKEKQVVVDDNDILDVVSKWTRIPLKRMEQGEIQRLLGMEKELSKVVVGQEEAVSVLCRALCRSRTNLKDPYRPIGAFALLGPTGVGKTLLAKSIAVQMFGDQKNLIHLDMSEYMEKFSVSRLIGAPPGYVGFEEGGQLTEQVRRKPYSVVLFDEIEKAHPDVPNMILQILEEGKLADSFGRTVDFRNTIILMTSNIGAKTAVDSNVIGFTQGEDREAYSVMRNRIMEQAKRSFNPEFINRLDDLIVFRSLSKENLIEILTLEVEKVLERLRQQEVLLELNQKAKEFLVDKGYDPKYGARPMRRAVEKYLEDPLAEEMLKGGLVENKSIKVYVDGDHLAFDQKAALEEKVSS